MILRLNCLRSGITAANGICFNSSLLPPYLKRIKSIKELLAMAVPMNGVSSAQ
ncbi:MAG: hypothetical protein ACTS73_03175 [Arsenophonus sp. NEOnobi-MAG3]